MMAVDIASATVLQAHTRHDARFDLPPEDVPYGGIALAVFLTVFGATCFVLAWMHFTQVIFGKEQAVSNAAQVTTRMMMAMAQPHTPHSTFTVFF
jgi:hypothetical protein